MFDGLFELISLVGIVVLVVVLVRQENRIKLLERELGALRSFVLSFPIPGLAQVGTPETASAASIVDERVAETASDRDATEPAGLPKAQTSLLAEAAPETTDAPLIAEQDLDRPREMGAVHPAETVAEIAAAASVQPKRRDIETALGTRWAVWVGGVALALGGIFLVRYTIEAGFFGPMMRLTLAGAFGLLLVAAGEFIRRTGFRVPVQGAAGAYIPAILTAAGAFTLFGTVYAAHGIYGFIGQTPAFLMLGAIALATLMLALVHGQALAGIGLLGSLVTPVLVSSESPKPWALFGYLAIVLVATVGISRIRRWRFLASAAFAGIGAWTLVYMVGINAVDLNIVALVSAVALACLALLWCVGSGEAQPAIFPSIVPAFFIGLVAVALLVDPLFQMDGGAWPGATLMIAMVAIAVWRTETLALLFGAGIFTSLAFVRLGLVGAFNVALMGEVILVDGVPAALSIDVLFFPGIALALAFLAAGLWQARALAPSTGFRAASWAAFAVVVPLVVVCALWFQLGDPNIDLRYAFAAVALTAVFVGGAEAVARAEEPPLNGGPAVSILLAGAGTAFVAAIHMAFGPALTTILIGAAAIIPALATRWRSYPALGWLSVAAVVVVLVRAAIDPTIVGAEDLGKTPVFNALLAGYGIPALAFAFSAWQLARTTAGRPRLAMEASAVFFALLTLAMLIRHAMHGGVIDLSDPTLAEQAIYTLIGLAAGAILISLDLRSPSSVLRFGSLAIGVLSVAAIAVQHFAVLNPLFTNELTGQIPVFNLLLLAYLLPALAAAVTGALCARQASAMVFGHAGDHGFGPGFHICDFLRAAAVQGRVHRGMEGPRAA